MDAELLEDFGRGQNDPLGLGRFALSKKRHREIEGSNSRHVGAPNGFHLLSDLAKSRLRAGEVTHSKIHAPLKGPESGLIDTSATVLQNSAVFKAEPASVLIASAVNKEKELVVHGSVDKARVALLLHQREPLLKEADPAV